MQIYGNWEEGLHIHYANLKRAGLDVLCKTVKISELEVSPYANEQPKKNYRRDCANIQNSGGAIYSNQCTHLKRIRLVVWAHE